MWLPERLGKENYYFPIISYQCSIPGEEKVGTYPQLSLAQFLYPSNDVTPLHCFPISSPLIFSFCNEEIVSLGSG